MNTDSAPAPASTAAIIVIGNEVLSGRTQDVNVNFIAGELAKQGIHLVEARIVADDEADIVAAVNACRERYSYVFTTGGIGATHDDITARCMAKAFGVPFGRHPGAEAALQAHYGDDLNESRLTMADMPEGADLIANPVSGAPGFVMGNVFVMAGVPVIAQAMFEQIRSQLKGGRVYASRTVHTNLTEGVIAADLARLAENHPAVDIGSYPYFRKGEVGINLVVRGEDEAAIAAAIEALTTLLAEHGGKAVEGENTGTGSASSP